MRFRDKVVAGVAMTGFVLASAVAANASTTYPSSDPGQNEVATSIEERGKSKLRKRQFSTRGRKGERGFATGRLAVRYESKRRWSQFNIRVKDRCAGNTDGDGKGAYLNGKIEYMDGSAWHGVDVQMTWGCGGDFHAERDLAWSPPTKKIRYVQVRVCEKDKDGPKPNTCTRRKKIDNPYTGRN